MALAPYYSGWATNMGITTQTEKLGISIEGRSLIRQRMRKKYSWEEIVFIPLSKIATNLFLLCDKCWVTMCFFSPNRKMFYVSVSKKSLVSVSCLLNSRSVCQPLYRHTSLWYQKGNTIGSQGNTTFGSLKYNSGKWKF